LNLSVARSVERIIRLGINVFIVLLTAASVNLLIFIRNSPRLAAPLSSKRGVGGELNKKSPKINPGA
jgi:hypothetical protein